MQAGYAGGATLLHTAGQYVCSTRCCRSCFDCWHRRCPATISLALESGYKWEIARASSFAFWAPAYRTASRDLPHRITDLQSLASLPAAPLQGLHGCTAGPCMYEIFRPYDLGSSRPETSAYHMYAIASRRSVSCESFLGCLVRDWGDIEWMK